MKRPFWMLWLIGMGKFVGSIGLGFGIIFGGAWVVRTHPRVADVFAMLLVALVIAFAGLVCAPKR